MDDVGVPVGTILPDQSSVVLRSWNFEDAEVSIGGRTESSTKLGPARSRGDLQVEIRETHLWIANLGQLPKHKVSEVSILSEEEIGWSASLPSPDLQLKFIRRRGFLRRTLSRYLKVEPDQIAFNYGRFGRPQVASSSHSNLDFNLSHKHEWAACVVAGGCRVGVDIEYLDRTIDLVRLARRCMSDEEYAQFRSCGDDQRVPMFFAAWTQKEAYLKAIGQRLSYGMARINVPIKSGVSARIGGLDQNGGWSYYTVSLGRYMVSIAAEKPIEHISIGHWSGFD